jgi:hypothetical protein
MHNERRLCSTLDVSYNCLRRAALIVRSGGLSRSSVVSVVFTTVLDNLHVMEHRRYIRKQGRYYHWDGDRVAEAFVDLMKRAPIELNADIMAGAKSGCRARELLKKTTFLMLEHCS